MASVERPVTQAVIDRFGEVLGTNNPVHHDRAFAVARGFPDCIAHGLMTHAIIADLLSLRFGTAAMTRAHLATEFVAPACVGDVLTADAREIRRHTQGDVDELDLEVWCENQRGDRVLSGRARLAVPVGTRG